MTTTPKTVTTRIKKIARLTIAVKRRDSRDGPPYLRSGNEGGEHIFAQGELLQLRTGMAMAPTTKTNDDQQ